MSLYVGLMSGTSLDAIDAVVVDFSHSAAPCQIIASHSEPIPPPLKRDLVSLCNTDDPALSQVTALDNAMGKLFAQATRQLLLDKNLAKTTITAIGSHGQTVFHQPNATPPVTLQIGDPNIISAETGITTVADFRRRDMALGGQGAPLAPAFHAHFFHDAQKDRAIINIGGIANITLLYADSARPSIGFDTGPGNVLLDSWITEHAQQAFDQGGGWAGEGRIQDDILAELLEDPYFHKQPPKSTGREYFKLSWLNHYLQRQTHNIQPQDIQATLTALTAYSIADAVKQRLPKGNTVILCGGGVHNNSLCSLIKQRLSQYHVTDSSTFGIDADYLEAIGFAWFAKQTIEKKAIDLTTITGAKSPAILGGVYYA